MIAYYSAFGFLKEDPNGYNDLPENPFMYRGYYYDHDLGMYYLNSRYYDQNTCRFINADGYISTGSGLLGYNMYAYCNNNPIKYIDPEGKGIVEAIIIICVAAFSMVMLNSCGKDIDSEPEPAPSITSQYPYADSMKTNYAGENIYIEVTVEIDDFKSDNAFIRLYVDTLADELDLKYSDFLGDSKIDRAQLFGEIKFHIISYESNFMEDSANPANISIYFNGLVIDGRPTVDIPSKILSGGYDD